MTPSSPTPPVIGVFDSGVGGLTVLAAIKKVHPTARTIYLGDTARVPYGTKSSATVQRYSVEIAQFLVTQGCTVIVIACNTASALALDAVVAAVDVPVIDVIQPTVGAAIRPGTRSVGVLATRGTVGSRAYARAIARWNDTIRVAQQPCPLFVPLVEEGWLERPVTDLVADEYVQAVLATGPIDTLILGCTHYPLLRGVIQNALHRAGSAAIILDSGEPTARALSECIGESSPHSEPDRFLVTDDPVSFTALATRFLGYSIPPAELVALRP